MVAGIRRVAFINGAGLALAAASSAELARAQAAAVEAAIDLNDPGLIIVDEVSPWPAARDRLADATLASYADVTAELAEAHAAAGAALHREIERQTLAVISGCDFSADAARIERPQRMPLHATFGLFEGNRKERRRARALARRR